MKRSEAIRLIEEVLHGAFDYPAITILDKLERVGMLPPTVLMGTSCSNEVIDMNTGKYEVCRERNMWEPEHGEKKHETNRAHGLARSGKKFNSFDPL